MSKHKFKTTKLKDMQEGHLYCCLEKDHAVILKTDTDYILFHEFDCMTSLNSGKELIALEGEDLWMDLGDFSSFIYKKFGDYASE